MTNNEKIEFWRKLSGNKKMIHAMPLVVEMIDMLETQEQTIVELRKEVERLEKQRNAILNTAIRSEEKYADLKGSFAARNLEQQAKGAVNGYVSACKWALGNQYDEYVAKNRALIYAQALKEQS